MPAASISVVDDNIELLHHGVIRQTFGESSTLNDENGTVLVKNHLETDPNETGAHEAFHHYITQYNEAAEECFNVIRNCLVMSNFQTADVLNRITQAKYGTNFIEITDAQADQCFEDLTDYIGVC